MCVLLEGIESHPDDQAFTTSMDNAKEKRREKEEGRERKLGGGIVCQTFRDPLVPSAAAIAVRILCAASTCKSGCMSGGVGWGTGTKVLSLLLLSLVSWGCVSYRRPISVLARELRVLGAGYHAISHNNCRQGAFDALDC